MDHHRPLIDRARPSYNHTYSRSSSPLTSPSITPHGSPLLKSVLKHHPSDGPTPLHLGDPAFDLDEEHFANGHRKGGGSRRGSNVSVSGSGAGAELGSIYSRRVGFDTFESGVDLAETGSTTGGGTGELILMGLALGAGALMDCLSLAGVNYSFTLSAKSADYARSKQTRTFLVGTDLNGSSPLPVSFSFVVGPD